MSQTAGDAEQHEGPAARLGFRPGQVVQELGWDEDTDDDLRIDIEDLTGGELLDQGAGDVADVVLQWWRDDDGDLTDALVDSLGDLAPGGVVWLLTPKVGRDGAVEASDIADAALTAGLSTTTTVSAGEEWAGTKLVAPKGSGRR